METTVEAAIGSADRTGAADGLCVTLVDGTSRQLAGLSQRELIALQWDQERDFAVRILAAPKGSLARAEATRHAYDTVTRVFAAVCQTAGEPLRMGLQPRQEQMVVDALRRQQRHGLQPRLLEIGYASGILLRRVSAAGFSVAGIEVSAQMRQQALALLGPQFASCLHLGDFLRYEFPRAEGPFTLVYWNDVFEHVAPDEILDYLTRIHELLAPGGQLITVTPNWHVRPSDITRMVRPARSEPEGLHLKEYTLREVSALLRRAGFVRVATPLVSLPGRIVLCGSGLAGWKRLVEPSLEALPYRLARLLCRGAGLSTTIATKAGRGIR